MVKYVEESDPCPRRHRLPRNHSITLRRVARSEVLPEYLRACHHAGIETVFDAVGFPQALA
jgi:hypothetical protein